MGCFDALGKAHSLSLVREEMRALEERRVAKESSAHTRIIEVEGEDSLVGEKEVPATAAAIPTAPSMHVSLLDDMLGADSDSDTSDGVAGPRLPTITQIIDAELEGFKQEKVLAKLLDPFEWWRDHKALYPLLAMVARKWLAVPASSASSERVFSSAGLTLTKKRQRLLPGRIAKLVFLKTAWPALEELQVLY